MPAKDRDGKGIVVLFVQGKGKSHKLVAPYLRRMPVRCAASLSPVADEPTERISFTPRGPLQMRAFGDRFPPPAPSD